MPNTREVDPLYHRGSTMRLAELLTKWLQEANLATSLLIYRYHKRDRSVHRDAETMDWYFQPDSTDRQRIKLLSFSCRSRNWGRFWGLPDKFAILASLSNNRGAGDPKLFFISSRIRCIMSSATEGTHSLSTRQHNPSMVRVVVGDRFV